MKTFVLSCAVLACCTPAFSQGPGGTGSGVADCPTASSGSFNGVYYYDTKSCSSSATGSGYTYAPVSNLPAPCNGTVCSEPVVGGGQKSANAELKPVAEPDPIRELGPEPRPFYNWKQVKDAFILRRAPCASRLGIAQIRKLGKSPVMCCKDTSGEMKKLKESIPAFVEKFKKASSFREQQDMITQFTKDFRKLVDVSIPLRKGWSNFHHGMDLPMQPRIGSPNSKFTIQEGRKGLKSKNAGVVKIVDGGQTFYFQLFELVLNADAQFVIRGGAQVSAPDDASAVKEAKFLNNRFWSHKIQNASGNVFLVSSKDQREASKPKQ